MGAKIGAQFGLMEGRKYFRTVNQFCEQVYVLGGLVLASAWIKKKKSRHELVEGMRIL